MITTTLDIDATKARVLATLTTSGPCNTALLRWAVKARSEADEIVLLDALADLLHERRIIRRVVGDFATVAPPARLRPQNRLVLWLTEPYNLFQATVGAVISASGVFVALSVLH